MNIIYNMYKRGLCALCLLVTVGMSVSAQQIRTSYFMESSTMRTSLNPAFQPERGYVSIPVLGTVGAALGTNGVSLDNFIYPTDGRTVTFLDQSVNAQEFLGGLKDQNQINVDFATKILSGGWYAGKGFWSVDVSIKGLTNLRAPKSLFEFMKLGNGSQQTYDIQNIRAYAEAYLETGVGYSRPITDKLTVGGKLKMLWGVGSANLNISNLHAEMNSDSWKITSQGTFEANVKGLTPELEVDNQNSEYISSFEYDSPGLSGFGLGVDLGATYQLTENITLSAAVLDLGFVSWSKSGSVIGKLDGKPFDFDGFDLQIGDNSNSDVPSMGDQFDAIKDDFADLLHFRQEAGASRATSLRTTINIGGEYRLLENKLGVGLLSTTRFYTPKAYTELTLSGNYRPVKWFEVALSYSFIHSNFKTYGIALNFSPSWINFFIGSDYMITKINPQMLPISGNAMNMYMGLSIPLRSFAN